MSLWDYRYVRAARNQFRPKASVLKHRLRNILRHLKRRLTTAGPARNDSAGGAIAAPKMKCIDNIQELDRVLKHVDERFAVSDDEGRKTFCEFCYVVDRHLPADPYSQEYYDAQMQLYQQISGRKTYSIGNEHTTFDLEAAKNAPFPYFTASADTVGGQLMAQGFLIRHLGLPAGSRLVEFGPGWGNTTLHFAQMGYQVTAVDAEPSFIELIKHRTESVCKPVELLTEDMLNFRTEEKYDAAVFFECFHHCSNHLKMLANLHDIIKDNGVVAFASEPITDFPYPWGIRLDGMSVWSIRKFGWMELGFNTSYFLRTLLLLGWTPRHIHSDVHPWTDVILARKSQLFYEPGQFTLPPDECATWAPKETDATSRLRYSGKKSTLTCQKDVQARQVEFCLSNPAPFDLKVTLSAGESRAAFKVPRFSPGSMYRLGIDKWDGIIRIAGETWRPHDVFWNGDHRELGVGVHSVRILE